MIRPGKTMTVVDDYALRYGDGEVEDGFESLEDVKDRVNQIRISIENHGWDPDDYEPMEILRRTVTTKTVVTEWEAI